MRHGLRRIVGPVLGLAILALAFAAIGGVLVALGWLGAQAGILPSARDTLADLAMRGFLVSAGLVMAAIVVWGAAAIGEALFPPRG